MLAGTLGGASVGLQGGCIEVARNLLPRIALIAALGLALSGCTTYPEPSILPPAGPAPPAGAIDLYRALTPEAMPSTWSSGIFPGMTQPATGYLPSRGVLLTVLPSPHGRKDGLYIGNPMTGRLTLAVAISPGSARDIATASALGAGSVAFQVGPESGPRSAPAEIATKPASPPVSLTVPPADRGSIDTSFHFEGDELVFLGTRSAGENDVTSVVACNLVRGSCRDLFRAASQRSSLDVIALGAGRSHAYLALKPADPGERVQGEIVAVPLDGGEPRTLWRTSGILTSMARGRGVLAFTEDFGVDEGLYLREGQTMIRITPPGEFPSNPTLGSGYIAWWADRPELLDLRSDRLYRIPGWMPELYGNLLTYVTPEGVRWVRLPPA